MGLIQALAGAIGGTLADQWIDFYAMDSLPANVLVAKGQRYTGGRGSNTKGSDNVITNGSGIVVGPGQGAAIVDGGIITEFTAQPGQYTYDQSSEPTIFGDGGLMANIGAVFHEGVERFKRGGGVYKDQRVYFFNLKEITGIKYGTPNPVPFRVVDQNIGLDVDIAIRCNGAYAIRVTNPILFFQSFAGNVGSVFTIDQISEQMKSELLTALQPAFAKISAMGIRYSALPAHTSDLAAALNEVLSTSWRDRMGIEITSFGVNSVTASEEDEQLIKDLQKAAVLRNPNMAGATIAAAQADAMRAAASNEAGAVTGFLGMGMAQGAGGANLAQLFQQGDQPVPASQYPVAADGGFPGQNDGIYAPSAPAAPAPAVPPQMTPTAPPAPPQQPPAPPQQPPAPAPEAPVAPVPEAPGAYQPPAPAAPAADVWTCPSCGKSDNTGKFCSECGMPRPV
ncbi:MAG: SPFH domain-containing protein [Propionibacteriaceae bacterium]|jgi:membrane protease subunit (stomatin/prohibitin family)|nr:SPFH domain-containing protein [Propionibacteriaceae bacterium]